MLSAGIAAFACTSAIVSPRLSASGRPMLWKHRDSSSESNFIATVAATDSTCAFMALFNAGDSLLAEAWIGVNDHGFAIMNTASYNLAPDTASYKDREGFIMAEALRHCTSLSDFRSFLSSLPRPLGVQANFGVIDSTGDGAFFETDDFSFIEFNLADATDGIALRTNFSFSGDSLGGRGYIRYHNAADILAPHISEGTLSPANFTEDASRSFYNSLTRYDAMTDTCRWAVDQDFIPRSASSASVVIEVAPDSGSVMWCALGYPPCAVVYPAAFSEVHPALLPSLPGHKSPAAEQSLDKKRKAFPITRGSGPRYIDMDYVRAESGNCHRQSIISYDR